MTNATVAIASSHSTEKTKAARWEGHGVDGKKRKSNDSKCCWWWVGGIRIPRRRPGFPLLPLQQQFSLLYPLLFRPLLVVVVVVLLAVQVGLTRLGLLAQHPVCCSRRPPSAWACYYWRRRCSSSCCCSFFSCWRTRERVTTRLCRQMVRRQRQSTTRSKKSHSKPNSFQKSVLLGTIPVPMDWPCTSQGNWYRYMGGTPWAREANDRSRFGGNVTYLGQPIGRFCWWPAPRATWWSLEIDCDDSV